MLLFYNSNYKVLKHAALALLNYSEATLLLKGAEMHYICRPVKTWIVLLSLGWKNWVKSLLD